MASPRPDSSSASPPQNDNGGKAAPPQNDSSPCHPEWCAKGAPRRIWVGDRKILFLGRSVREERRARTSKHPRCSGARRSSLGRPFTLIRAQVALLVLQAAATPARIIPAEIEVGGGRLGSKDALDFCQKAHRFSLISGHAAAKSRGCYQHGLYPSNHARTKVIALCPVGRRQPWSADFSPHLFVPERVERTMRTEARAPSGALPATGCLGVGVNVLGLWPYPLESHGFRTAQQPRTGQSCRSHPVRRTSS